MSTKNKIFIYQKKHNLAIKLTGDFDITLANKLIYFLKNNSDSIPKVLVHQNCKKHIYPFLWEEYKATAQYNSGRIKFCVK